MKRNHSQSQFFSNREPVSPACVADTPAQDASLELSLEKTRDKQQRMLLDAIIKKVKLHELLFVSLPAYGQCIDLENYKFLPNYIPVAEGIDQIDKKIAEIKNSIMDLEDRIAVQHCIDVLAGGERGCHKRGL
jgi:hypothetical protein